MPRNNARMTRLSLLCLVLPVTALLALQLANLATIIDKEDANDYSGDGIGLVSNHDTAINHGFKRNEATGHSIRKNNLTFLHV
jgi:hypothetical protein